MSIKLKEIFSYKDDVQALTFESALLGFFIAATIVSLTKGQYWWAAIDLCLAGWSFYSAKRAANSLRWIQ